MDKSCHSSGESTTTTASSSSGSSNRDEYLKHLNKISHKISKPVRKPPFDNTHQQQHQNILLQHHQTPPLPPAPPLPLPPQPQNLQQQQHQPPVYNINKNDFRDVVQKLTGSPAHERFSTPPPINPPKPQSSRLQRIRPPPLAHVSNRPPPLLNNTTAAAAQPPPPITTAGINPSNFIINPPAPACNFGPNLRHISPPSPLPPFPTVHGAAESPISAYMRYLQSSISTVDSDPKQLSRYTPLISPRWNNPPPAQLQSHQQQLPPQQQQPIPSPTISSMASVASSQFMMPGSPLPFGCLPSPRLPYPLLSPGLLFSPTAGQLGQFPLSPRLPVPSPRWKDL